MNKLVVSYTGGSPMSEEECIRTFDLDPDMSIAGIYSKYFGMLYAYASKFPFLSKLDIESLAFESIYKCLETFSFNKDAKFSTYLTNVFRNRVIREYRYIDAPSKYRNWYMQVSFDNHLTDEDDFSVFSTLGYEEDFGKLEIEASVEYMTLSNTEYAYIMSVLEEGPSVSDAKIADEIGVTRAAVYQAKKKLQKKLKDFL